MTCIVKEAAELVTKISELRLEVQATYDQWYSLAKLNSLTREQGKLKTTLEKRWNNLNHELTGLVRTHKDLVKQALFI